MNEKCGFPGSNGPCPLSVGEGGFCNGTTQLQSCAGHMWTYTNCAACSDSSGTVSCTH